MEQKGVYETTTRTHARTDVLYHLIVFITEITKRVCDTTAIVEDFWSWRNQSHSGQGSATQRNSITPKKVACKNVLVLGPVKTKFLFFFDLKVFLSYLLANMVVFSDIIWAWITEERELSLVCISGGRSRHCQHCLIRIYTQRNLQVIFACTRFRITTPKCRKAEHNQWCSWNYTPEVQISQFYETWPMADLSCERSLLRLTSDSKFCARRCRIVWYNHEKVISNIRLTG